MCFSSFREKQITCQSLQIHGKDFHPTPGKGATREQHLAWILSSRDGWLTGVRRGTQTSEEVQESRNLIAVVAFPFFPTFNHLPRSLLPFKFGIPNAHQWLSERHSCRSGKPRHTQL